MDTVKNIRGFEKVNEEFMKNAYSKRYKLPLPKKCSLESAGYDFYSPVATVIKPKTAELIWTDIKAYMGHQEVLQLYVRSSIGIKKHLMLANTVGIIDSDYYNNVSNDGNIGICLYNYGNEEVEIKYLERIAQGIFINYLNSNSGNTGNTDTRIGGIGSTGI